MNILVTGGAGFIGSHLVDELVKKGHDVDVVDDLSIGNFSNIRKHRDISEFYFLDEKVESIKRWVGDFDVVYHLAAQHSVPDSMKNPMKYYKANVLGTANMLKFFPDARFVNISSSSAIECKSPYAISKKAGELMTNLHKNSVSLRLFNVFGERQADLGCIMTEFAKNMMKDEPPVIYGDGSQTRDFTYVKDVVTEILRYGQGKKKKLNGIYEVGYGDSISVNKACSIMHKLFGSTALPEYGEPRAGDIWYSRAKNKMVNPKYGFKKGLERTVKWIKANPEWYS